MASVPPTAESAVTLAEARAHLNQSEQQSDGDKAELERFISAASASAERWTHRVLAPRDVVEVHDVGRDPVVFLRSRPVISLGAVTIDKSRPSETVAADAELRPDTGELRVPRAAGRQITVSFRAGMDPVPDQYRVGVLMIVAHLWRTQRRPLGQQSRFGGQNADDESVMVAGFAVPRAALEMLGPAGVT